MTETAPPPPLWQQEQINRLRQKKQSIYLIAKELHLPESAVAAIVKYQRRRISTGSIWFGLRKCKARPERCPRCGRLSTVMFGPICLVYAMKDYSRAKEFWEDGGEKNV